MTTSTPFMAFARDFLLRTLPVKHSTDDGYSAFGYGATSKSFTCQPFFMKKCARCSPKNPAPPVIKIVIMNNYKQKALLISNRLFYFFNQFYWILSFAFKNSHFTLFRLQEN